MYPLELVKARQICRSIRSLVDASKRAQLVIELARSGYLLACDVNSLSSVPDMLVKHWAWRRNLIDLPKPVAISLPLDMDVVRRFFVFDDHIFITTTEGVYSLSISDFAQTATADWKVVESVGFTIKFIIFVDTSANVLVVGATEYDSTNPELLFLTLDTLLPIPGALKLSMTNTWNHKVSGSTLMFIDNGETPIPILRVMNWQTGNIIKEMNIEVDESSPCPTLLAEKYLLLASIEDSKITITVIDLHKPHHPIHFHLPRPIVASGLTWLIQNEQVTTGILSSTGEHDICALNICLGRTVQRNAAQVIIKYNTFLRLASGTDKSRFDWSEWGPICARILPACHRGPLNDAISGSRILVSLPEQILSPYPARAEKRRGFSRMVMLDFNPNMAPAAHGRLLRVVKGKLEDRFFANTFSSDETSDGVSFIIHDQSVRVLRKGPTANLYLTASSVILDHVDSISLVWLGQPC